MSLDVYVMPMWRFKAGDVETAVQRLFGDRSRVITLQSIFSLQRINGFIARHRARREVQQIIAEAEQKLSISLKWNDDGEVVYSQQAWWGFEALRAFARWLDLQDHFSEFNDPPEGNFYKHPAMTWNEERRAFQFSHIIDHSCYSGYFVPCRFDRVVFVERYQMFGRITFHHSFGSSYTLRKQLSELGDHLPSKDRFTNISEKSRELIRAGFDTLNALSEKSIEHKLPIIFWG